VSFDSPGRTPVEPKAPPLRSFWIAGYEGADHLSGSGLAFDLIDAAGQAERVLDDYRAARDVGIACVRETVGWRRVERPYGFDFEGLRLRAEAARRYGIQVLWTLCQGDWPHDVDVLADDFPQRFAAYAAACAQAVRDAGDDEAPVFTPLEEISFLSWGVAETGLFNAHRRDLRSQGFEVKRRLVTATLAACMAIRAIDPRARFLHMEPLARRTGNAPSPQAFTTGESLGGDDEYPGERPRHDAAFQFQAWDMLWGRSEPQLGGNPRYVDLLGVNCYASRQIESRTLAPLPGRRGERRRMPLHRMLAEVNARYGRPVVVGERSPIGVNRAGWLREIGDEIREALMNGIPVAGTCLHPLADRPKWKDPQRWRAHDLWEDVLRPQRQSQWPRSLYLQTLRTVQARVDPALIRSP
jgi:UDP-galactopyranose mutase